MPIFDLPAVPVAGGTRAMQDGEPLLRACRDISALRTRDLLDRERTAESYGRQVFGLDPLGRLPGFWRTAPIS